MELEKAGFAGNTLVMLKSDHGIPVPFAKTNVWRHSTLTPWLVRWPGVVKPGARTESILWQVGFCPDRSLMPWAYLRWGNGWTFIFTGVKGKEAKGT